MLEKSEILERVKDAVSRVTGSSLDDITPDTKLGEDIPADSLDVVDIVMNLEDNLDVDLDDDAVAATEDIDGLVDLIYKALQDQDQD